MDALGVDLLLVVDREYRQKGTPLMSGEFRTSVKLPPFFA